jgi:hypothetical protein
MRPLLTLRPVLGSLLAFRVTLVRISVGFSRSVTVRYS